MLRRLAPPLLALIGTLALAGCGLVQDPQANGTPRSTAASSGDAPAVSTPAKGTIDEALGQLDVLEVAPAGSMSGYSRDRFAHWRDPDKNGCDAREDTLVRDGKKVRTGDGCKVLSGSWVDPYGGSKTTDPGALDIDHVVPLANAWRSGANDWTDETRSSYANDPDVLLAVDAGLNREKGDKGPEAWKPPLRDYWPAYAAHWIAIKYKYRLSVNAQEKAALRTMLGES